MEEELEDYEGVEVLPPRDRGLLELLGVLEVLLVLRAVAEQKGWKWMKGMEYLSAHLIHLRT